MGYYTDFQLEIVSDLDKELLQSTEDIYKRISGALTTNANPDDDNNDLLEIITILREDGYANLKWYDHEDDMKDLSNKVANVLFKLSGKGEDDEDLWIKYFFNGRMQVCNAHITITYDPLDFEKMR